MESCDCLRLPWSGLPSSLYSTKWDLIVTSFDVTCSSFGETSNGKERGRGLKREKKRENAEGVL